MTAPGYERIGDWTGDVDAVISVCIANFNGSEVIAACIQSVLDQQVDAPFEIIVHDDASTDDSLRVLTERFPSVKVIKGTDNVGFCISNNRMVEHSSAEYVLLLNNDAVLRPGALSAFYNRAREQGQSEILGLPQYSMEDGALIDRGYEFDIFMNPIPKIDEGVNDVATATGACLWVPRVVWDQVGGFPEWFESVAEDIYLCHAARLLGYRITVLQEPGFDHSIGKVLGGGKTVAGKLVSTIRRRALSERNKTAVMLVCYPMPALLIILPVHLILLALESSLLLLCGLGYEKINSVYFKMPKSLLNRYSYIKLLRREIRKKRELGNLAYLTRFRFLPWKFLLFLRYGFPEVK